MQILECALLAFIRYTDVKEGTLTLQKPVGASASPTFLSIFDNEILHTSGTALEAESLSSPTVRRMLE